MDRLDNTVRPYAWGSTTAIPELLGTEPTGEPQAELWMGAHPGAPSRIDRGSGPVPLPDIITADPAGELGPDVVSAFGPRLPFLLKILAAGAPLSLQVHPDRAQAAAGFAAEEARGVPLDAPHRTYRDDQHKPELICALTQFDGLCGFRTPERTAQLIDALGIDELAPYTDILRARSADSALREVFSAILTTDRQRQRPTITRIANEANRLAAAGGPDTAAYAAYAGLAQDFPDDPGVLAAMLLNHVQLRPGEALHLDAGVPHAYLQGLGVEVMANSDNVLRSGLTSKHMDVPELLRIVNFRSGDPGVLRPEADADGEEIYPTPFREFQLSRRLLSAGAPSRTLLGGRAQLVLCTEGTVRLTEASGAHLDLPRGTSAWLPAAAGPVQCAGPGTLFRVTVPRATVTRHPAAGHPAAGLRPAARFEDDVRRRC